MSLRNRQIPLPSARAQGAQVRLRGLAGAVMKSNAERPHYPLVVLLQDIEGHRLTPRTVDLGQESFVRLELMH